MLEKLRKKVDFPPEKFLLSYQDYGNTVSSTIPLGLIKAIRERKIEKGHKVLLVGFGVGYSWAGTLVTL
jgi:3-oxoacyl-[acyl-carrier-protein] synthase-3